jgi:RNA-directed DNA polymerase
MNAKELYRGDKRPTVVVAAASQASQATLQALNGPEAGRVFVLPALPCRIGRGGASELRLADPNDPPTLSREHATFAHPTGESREILVTDHSRNGTRVGERRLGYGMSEILRPATTLWLGAGLRLLFQQQGEQVSEAGVRDLGGKAGSIRGVSAPLPAMPPSAKKELPADFRAFLTSPATLHAAWKRVALNRGGAGPDNVTLHEFSQEADRRLDALRTLLIKGRYEPLPARLFAAPKRNGGVRSIAILSIQDRIVQQALHAALQPHLEPHFPPCSYAYRPGMSAHHALRAVDSQLSQGNLWVAETDIARFFDTIGHEVLLNQLRALVPDPFVLSLVARCLSVGGVGGRGIPQGAATSPLFSNLYLAEFDAAMLGSGRNPIRYGDDLLFPCRERGQAQIALSEVEGFLRSRLGLALKPEKTGVASLAQGFTFLGFQFTEAGRQAAPQAVAHLVERLQEVAPADAPAVLRGWKTYFGEAPGAQQTNAPAFSPQAASGSELQEAEMERFLKLFRGREDTYARQSNDNGKTRFTPCAGPLTPELVHDHLSGRETLATYLIRQDGMVRHLVLDMDLAASPGRPAAQSQASASELEGVVRFAAELQRICREIGLPATLEDSGRRGRHLWIFFAEPVAPDRARRLGHLLALRAGFPRPGIRLEILPRHSDWPGPELGDAVKLPLGVHPLTGRRCFFLDAAGEPIPDVLAALERVRTLPSARVEELIGVLSRTPGEAPKQNQTALPESQPVAQLLAGCSVLRGLVERAQTTGHLRHTHQLILLYTAGRLGGEGAAFLHQTIAHCHNYDAEICQGYIDRLETNHPPLSCRRIREWLAEEGEAGLCTCSASRRTPLEGVGSRQQAEEVASGADPAPSSPRKPRASGFPAPRPLRASEVAGEEWRGVTEDLFGSADTSETETLENKRVREEESPS